MTPMHAEDEERKGRRRRHVSNVQMSRASINNNLSHGRYESMPA